jgi:hypothetical protein
MKRLNVAVQQQVPPLPKSFGLTQVALLPRIIARAAAGPRLRERGCPPGSVTPGAIARLLAMAEDAATPARQQFPGGLLVYRRQGRICA